MNNSNIKIICPVCGIEGAVEYLPWENGLTPSQDTCPCCGTHYGEDDWGETKEEINKNHIKLRKKWIQSGMKWCSKYDLPLENWNPKDQLKNLENNGISQN